MMRILHYYGRYQALRGRWAGLPNWARGVVMLFALPGLVALALSIAAVLVSLAALLVLTVPVYRLLGALVGGTEAPGGGPVGTWPEDVLEAGSVVIEPAPASASGRRHVDVKIVEE